MAERFMSARESCGVPQNEIKLTLVPKTTVTIIGTAGRGSVLAKMGSDLFSKMVTKAKDIIVNDLGLTPSKVMLVSGGAAWSGKLYGDELSYFIY